MFATTLFQNALLTVSEYRCTAGPNDKPFTEVHQSYSISYVRRGSFGYRVRGESFDLISGSLMIANAGDEYMCTHEHHDCGDECLSFNFTPESASLLSERTSGVAWRVGHVPPHSELMVYGELAQSIVDGQSNLSLDEVAVVLADRFVESIGGRKQRAARVTLRDRRRAIEAALWLEHYSHQEIDLETVAKQFDLSPFHFLRLFSAVTGVSPHQYLVRTRLRRAAQFLVSPERSVTDIAIDVGFGDLSNFIRTFHRAAGASPRDFRKAAQGDRKILQDRITARC